MRIFAGIPGEGRQDSGVVENGNFLAISLAISSETLEMRPALVYSD